MFSWSRFDPALRIPIWDFDLKAPKINCGDHIDVQMEHLQSNRSSLNVHAALRIPIANSTRKALQNLLRIRPAVPYSRRPPFGVYKDDDVHVVYRADRS